MCLKTTLCPQPAQLGRPLFHALVSNSYTHWVVPFNIAALILHPLLCVFKYLPSQGNAQYPKGFRFERQLLLFISGNFEYIRMNSIKDIQCSKKKPCVRPFLSLSLTHTHTLSFAIRAQSLSWPSHRKKARRELRSDSRGKSYDLTRMMA